MRVTIEKLIYGGDGLARLDADGQGRRKALFVPFTIDGEDVEVRVAEERPSFARGVVDQVVNPSPHRVDPGCPYFSECGGCQYQHIDYPHQLSVKADILRETVARIAKAELPGEIIIHSAEPWHHRNRTRFHVQADPEFAIGYHRANSNRLLPVKECPISSPLINRGLAALWQASEILPREAREIQLFANQTDSQLLVEVYVAPGKRDLKDVWEFLQQQLPEIVGLVVFEATRQIEDGDRSPLALTATKPIQSFGLDHLRYSVGRHDYRVSGGSFFQTNRFLIDELVRVVTDGHSGKAALDLYCGAGLFSVPLARSFEKVTAVESSPQSVSDLKHNAPSNVGVIQNRVDQFLEQGKRSTADYVVIDPPRAGLGEKVAAALGRMNTPRVTYVSCEPSTLSRDLRILLQSGFRIQKAHLVDLFPQTFHMESILELVR